MRQSTAIQVSVQRSHPDVNTGLAGIGTGCDDPGVGDALVALLKAVDQPVVASVTEGSLLTMGAIAPRSLGAGCFKAWVGSTIATAVGSGLCNAFIAWVGAIARLCKWMVGMDTGRGVSRLAQALANDQAHHWFPVATAARDDHGLNAFLHHCFTHHGQPFAALIHADWSLFPLSSTKGNHE